MYRISGILMRVAALAVAALLSLWLLKVLSPIPGLTQSRPVAVFADESLSYVLREAARSYARNSKAAIIFTFGSSADLAKQIDNGAPAQIVAFLRDSWIDRAKQANRIERDALMQPAGRLTLIAPLDSEVEMLIDSMNPISAFLGPGKLAIGDPNHSVLGRYAKEALIKLRDWERLEGRLLPARNGHDAVELVESGRAELGLVFYSNMIGSKKVKIAGHFAAKVYSSTSYTFAILRGEDSGDARAFFDFLTGPDAKEILAKYDLFTG